MQRRPRQDAARRHVDSQRPASWQTESRLFKARIKSHVTLSSSKPWARGSDRQYDSFLHNGPQFLSSSSLDTCGRGVSECRGDKLCYDDDKLCQTCCVGVRLTRGACSNSIHLTVRKVFKQYSPDGIKGVQTVFT